MDSFCQSDWIPTKHSVLCELHFEDIYRNKGKRMSLSWSMKPVSTIHSSELINTPYVLPTTQTFRQPPTKKIFQEDQLDSFRIHGKIKSLGGLNQSHSSPGFEFRQFEGRVIFYRLKLDNIWQFPTILESIRIDKYFANPVAIKTSKNAIHKFNALSRITAHFDLKKKKLMINSFFMSQFSLLSANLDVS